MAALARAARRPVKLVFSRREEFVAPDHRREGMVIELETGVTRDGRLVARRGALLLDNGAYTGEGGFFAQMAAMHACGPYELDNVAVEALLTYSTNQPSGSVRAPTAPQTCWALEQHLDEVAAAIGLDPAELRRRTLIAGRRRGPDRPGLRRDRDAPDPRGGARDDRVRRTELPDDEAIGVACGWWPSFASPSGRLRQAQRRRHRHDRHRRAGVRHRRRDGAARCSRPRCSGMRPEDFSILYQDTDAGPWDMGASGSQTTFNNGRAVIAAAPGGARSSCSTWPPSSSRSAGPTSSSPTATVRVVGRARDVGDHRRAGRHRHRRCSARAPATSPRTRPPSIPSACVGPAGHGVVRRPAAHHPRGARQGRPRDRRRPGAWPSRPPTTRA